MANANKNKPEVPDVGMMAALIVMSCVTMMQELTQRLELKCRVNARRLGPLLAVSNAVWRPRHYQLPNF